MKVYLKVCSNEPRALIIQRPNSDSLFTDYLELYYIDRTIPAMPCLKYICRATDLPVLFKEVTDTLDIKFWTETVKEI